MRIKPRRLLLIPALLIQLPLLGLALGACRDPTASLHGVLGSLLWTTVGPHLVLLALLGLVLGWQALRQDRGWPVRLLRVLLILPVLMSSYVTARFVSAVVDAGGSVNLLRGLWLTSMSAPAPDALQTFRTFDDEVLQAALYRPASVPAAASAPVLVYIHGGGFMTGSRTETAADLRWFADQGWLVFSIDYRLFTAQRPTWDLAPADVACGLAWAASEAAALGGDPTRWVVMGDSAGGNLALNVSYAAARGERASDCGPVPVPAAVVVQYPAVDPLAIYERGYPIPGFEPVMLVSGYLGGPPALHPARVQAVSSASYLSPAAPPTLILAPVKDSLVPYAAVRTFAEQAQAAGVAMTLVPLPFANHVYNQMAAGSIGNQARRTLTRRYLQAQALWPATVSR